MIKLAILMGTNGVIGRGRQCEAAGRAGIR